MPNIEDQEAEYPVLYLFRRHLKDSGGPGRFRGGRSAELAYTVHKAPDDRLDGLFAGTGAEMPNAIGIGGGMPGAAIRIARVLGTDISGKIGTAAPLPATLPEINGRLEILPPKHTRSSMDLGDVWYHSWQAGGGYGDPLRRDPERVALDVARKAVSSFAAEAIYGVVLDQEGACDLKATEKKRKSLRSERLKKATVPSADDVVVSFAGAGRKQIAETLVIDFQKDTVTCAECGHVHCRPKDNLLSHLREVNGPLNDAGPVRGEDYDSGRFRLRQLCCSHCGSLVDVQVALKGAPRPYFRIDNWPTAAAAE